MNSEDKYYQQSADQIAESINKDILKRVMEIGIKEKVDSRNKKLNKVMNPIVINIIAGPCVGKSTTAAKIFYELKIRDLNAELTSEAAKWMTYEENFKMMSNQLKLFAEQQHQIFRLLDKVDYIIMDSPLILSAIYDVEQSEPLRNLVIYEHNKLNNLTYFINRETEYKEHGRYHNLEQAIEVDNKILNFLDTYDIKYERVALNNVIDKILKDLDI